METYLDGTVYNTVLMVTSIQKWDVLDSQGDTKL
jgi:hypothetical protein